MKLAQRVDRLGTESAFKVLAQAQALEAKGVDVVHLEIGEPDFDTPRNICDAGIKAINDGYTHYCPSQGIPALRAEVAREMERTRGISVSPDHIIITPGAKPIIFYSILALLDKGDEAIYTNPLFPIYESMINFSGATAVPIPLREELDFRFDVAELEAKITPRTKIIFLNYPQNPTGGVLGESDIRAIAEIAKKHDLTVIRISDPREEEIPDLVLVHLRDPETGQVTLVNTGSRDLRERWRNYRRDQEASLSDLLMSTGVDLVDISTNGSVVEPLARLFDKRRRRMA